MTDTNTAPASVEKSPMTKEHKKVLAGSMVGTTIEWFDFFIYAQAAGLIFAAQYFSPVASESPTLAKILSWATIGISFLFRPLGAIIAGHLGDRLGRKPVLVLTLLGMGAATMLIGLLPNHEAIGLAAPILLILLRILQGLSAGGEWGGAAMLAVEHAPHGRRGFFGSFPQVGVPAGMALATVFMLILSSVLSQEQFMAWGWRVPFISSIILIALGFYIRSLVEESPAFSEMQELQEKASAPLAELFKNHFPTVFKCALIFSANNVFGYFVIAFLVSYGTEYIGYERTTVLAVTLVGAIAWFFSTFIFGAFSDKVGRKRTFFWGYIALAAWAIPMWLLVDSGNLALFVFAIAILGVLLAVTYGPQSALYAEMFPLNVRLSGVSIGYALGSIMGGAFAAAIAESLLELTGTSMAIAGYGIVMCVFSLIAVSRVPNGIQDRNLHD